MSRSIRSGIQHHLPVSFVYIHKLCIVTIYAYGGNFGHYYETWKDDSERMGPLHRFQLRSLNDHEDAVRRRPH